MPASCGHSLGSRAPFTWSKQIAVPIDGPGDIIYRSAGPFRKTSDTLGRSDVCCSASEGLELAIFPAA